MKHKTIIIISSILIIFVTGFICGKLMKPFKSRDLVKTEIIFDKTDLLNNYKKQSEAYIDSANSEMFNFSLKYFHISPRLLPDYYIDATGDSVIFNKENFFYYYSMYKITNHLSKAKSSIINGMLLESKDTTSISF